MKYSIIIPVFNGVEKILRSIESIQRQSSVLTGDDEFRCIVVDGASTDGTADVVRSISDARIELISEPDSGMYDALSKGLLKSEGDICCYLPAGETFESSAFSTVSEIFANHVAIHWLTGVMVEKNKNQQVIDTFLPPPFKRKYLLKGLYGTRLHVVQQESTFWRMELNNSIQFDTLKSCQLAGDYFLWKCFAKRYQLIVVNSILCSFTREEGQLSSQVKGAYRSELRELRDNPTLFDEIWATVLRKTYRRIKNARRAKGIVRFDCETNQWKLS
ncbi:MAG: glycosyltransferase [Cognatishimia sp.]